MKNLIVWGGRALLLFACCIAFATSCVNEDYSLKDENLNLEITPFMKGLIFPLGKTDRIELQDLLADVQSDVLSVDDDGGYTISFGGLFGVDSGLSDLQTMVNIPDIDFSEDMGLNFSNVTARAAIGSIAANVGNEYAVDFLAASDIPSEIVSVGLVELKDTYINVSINASDLPSFNGNVAAFDFDVTFPAWVKIEGADENGVVSIKGEFSDNSRVKTLNVRVVSVDLSGMNLDRDITMSVRIEGVVSMSASYVDVSQWIGRSLSLGVDIGMYDIVISKVSCKLNYSLDPVSETIDLSDLDSFFDELGSDVNLDFNRAALSLDIATNLGIHAIADVKLIPYYDGIADDAKAINAEIVVNASESADDEAVTYYMFDEAGLLELLESIPERLEFRADVHSDPYKYSILEPEAEYGLSVDYGFELPLEFGEDFTMTYKHIIPDMPAIVGSILSLGNKVMLSGEIENSLPLGFELGLNFLDSDDRVIPAIEGSGVQNVSPCTRDGGAVKTKLEMLVGLEEGVRVEDVASIELVFKASSKGASGIQLSADDYLQAEFQLVLPEGITIDLDDIINGEEINPEDHE